MVLCFNGPNGIARGESEMHGGDRVAAVLKAQGIPFRVVSVRRVEGGATRMTIEISTTDDDKFRPGVRGDIKS